MLAILAALATFAGNASAETVIYSFRGSETSGPDGSTPYASLIAAKDGSFYGTTYYGGSDGLGTVFELTPPATAGGAWTETVLFSFRNYSTNGGHPTNGVIFDEEGNLYGMAEGGAHAAGILFEQMAPTTKGGRTKLDAGSKP
jgi:uncharacterized repeat protein (TIGR03803 family)